MGRMKPKAFLWVDVETPGLPEGNDFSKIPLMEIGAILTNLDLTPITGYYDSVKLTKAHALALRDNPEVLEMHKTSGLIAECAESDRTAEELEREVIEILEEAGLEKGEVILAGSGVTAFDHPLIKEQMPELASWLTYYSLDVGIIRRALFHLGDGRKYVDLVSESFKSGHKKHRAYDDIKAHLKEAESYKEWLHNIPKEA